MKRCRSLFQVLRLLTLALLAPSETRAQHAFGIMGDYLVNIHNIENADLGLRLSYDKTLGDDWILRGMVGGMAGGQVALYEAVPKPAYSTLPIDTVKVDERDRYVHFTVGARRYLFGGGFSGGGVYAHLGVHLGIWNYSADPVDFDEERYQLPAIGPQEEDNTLVMFPLGIGYEKRFDTLVPFAEVAFMPGTSLGEGAEPIEGWAFTLGLRLPFGEKKAD